MKSNKKRNFIVIFIVNSIYLKIKNHFKIGHLMILAQTELSITDN